MPGIILNVDDYRRSHDERNAEHTPSSIDDCTRKELLWENREEKLLLIWCKDCKKRAYKHEIKLSLLS